MQARDKLLELLQRVGNAEGLPLGPRLATTQGHQLPVVGKVADDEPLCRSQEALALDDPQRLLRGLGALSLAAASQRSYLAVREDYHRSLEVLSRLARGLRVEVLSVPARYPLDDAALLTLLAQRSGQSPGSMTTPHVYDAVVLSDVGRAIAGEPLGSRAVTVAGHVANPGVFELPLGAVLEDVVQAAGGSLSGAWVALEGANTPHHLLDGEASVDLHTRLLLVLPNHHPRAVASRLPLEEALRRVAASCTSCASCSHVCPAPGCYPAELMRDVKRGYGAEPRLPNVASGVEACSECGLCSMVCPAGLDPARICSAVLAQLAERGALGRSAVSTGAGGWPMAALESRYGRAPRDASLRRSRLERLMIPLKGRRRGEREALVGEGDRFGRGALLARGKGGLVDLYAPLAGHVEAVDRDLGLVLRCA